MQSALSTVVCKIVLFTAEIQWRHDQGSLFCILLSPGGGVNLWAYRGHSVKKRLAGTGNARSDGVIQLQRNRCMLEKFNVALFWIVGSIHNGDITVRVLWYN
jgi:hypothetical protein